MATTSVNYSANATITMDLANLATSGSFVAGRESAEIDNTTNKYIDAIVQGIVYVGTSPTINTTIIIHAYGSDRSLTGAGAWPSGGALDNLNGSDSAASMSNTNAGILYSSLKIAAVINVLQATTNAGYPVAPFSVAQLFGGVLPKFWGLYVAHNTGQSLYNNALNQNSFRYYGVKYDSA